MTAAVVGRLLWLSLASTTGAVGGFLIGAGIGTNQPFFGSIWSIPPDDSSYFGGLGACAGALVGLVIALLPWRRPVRLCSGLVVLERSGVGTEAWRVAILALPLLGLVGTLLHVMSPQLSSPMLVVGESLATWASLVVACVLPGVAVRLQRKRRTRAQFTATLVCLPAVGWLVLAVWFLPHTWSLHRAERISTEGLHLFREWRDAYVAQDEARMKSLRDRGGPLVAEVIDRLDALPPAFRRTGESSSWQQLQNDWGYPDGRPYGR